jgi:peptide/nickel transport system substrate-binding protein
MESSKSRSHFTVRRLSRRKALKVGGVGLGAAALALAGCRGGDTPLEGSDAGATSSATDVPQYGGDEIMGLIADPGGLDVMQSVTGFWCSALMNGYLHSVNTSDQTLAPQMAESVEVVDKTTYVWKLRQGIKFHNVDPTWGREVTADDAVFSMQRRRDDPTIMNDKQLLRDFTSRLEAADKYTFSLTTTRPYAPALDETGNPSYPIIPHEAIEKWGDLSQHPIGCGAFVLDAYVRSERLKVVKNADFYMPGRPFMDSIEWIMMGDEAALFQAFRTKRHDFCGAPLDKLKVEELSDIKHVVVRKSPNYWNRCLLVRVDREPFDDERMRTAVDLAVDRQDLIDKMAFGEGLFNGPVSPSLEFWALPQDEVREFYKVDLTEARRLVEAAGYGGGVEVDAPVMNTQNLTKDAAIVKEHLAKIGITLNIQPKDIATLLAQYLYAGNFEILWFYNLPYVEPDRPICQWFSKGIAGISFTGYNNPVMDDWVWKERSEFDPQKRREIVLDAQRAMMNEHGPQINTYSPQSWVATWDWLHSLYPERGTGLASRTFLGIDGWMTERS